LVDSCNLKSLFETDMDYVFVPTLIQ